MRRSLLIAICLLLIPSMALSTYTLDSSRVVTWAGNAGLDPVGGIPNYTSVTCTGVHADNTTDDAAHIQTCINNASANTAVYLPAGTYLASSQDITLKDNVVLRGAGMGVTTIRFTGGRHLIIAGGSDSNRGTEIAINSGYTQGSTSLVLANVSGLSVGDWISIYQDDDSNYLFKTCSYCGEDDAAYHIIQQFSKITAIDNLTVSITPSIHYITTPTASGMAIKKMTWHRKYSGIEDITINGSGAVAPVVRIYYGLYNWIKNSEVTYTSGQEIIGIHHSNGVEVRDSNVHRCTEYGNGGFCYGIRMLMWNSAHKIENNIVYNTRHSILSDGGNSGSVILYNFTDNNYESNATSMLTEDLVANHGSHPNFDLYEGNSASNLVGDYAHGSSSHITFFRNHARIQRTTPSVSTYPVGFDVQAYNRYYNLVGNVGGTSGISSGTVEQDGNCVISGYVIFLFGCDQWQQLYGDSQSGSTALKHGNYDFVTDGVVDWDGGADHTIANSLYYNAKPSWWCTETPWPPIGPDVSGYYNDIPAKRRAQGDACTLATGESSTPTITSPMDNAVASWPISFEWTGVANAIRYHIQVDTNSSFTNCPGANCPYEDQEIDPDTACIDLDCILLVDQGEGLLGGQHYYWRVRALVQ